MGLLWKTVAAIGKGRFCQNHNAKREQNHQSPEDLPGLARMGFTLHQLLTRKLLCPIVQLSVITGQTDINLSLKYLKYEHTLKDTHDSQCHFNSQPLFCF